jgi:hypothetical protein
MIKAEYKTDCYCKGNDEKLIVLVTDPKLVDILPAFIEEKTHLFHQKIEIQVVKEILRNEAGKVINQSKTWRTANGGKIKIFGGDPEADKAIQDKGREANAAAWVQRRSIQETVKLMLNQKANSADIEQYGLEAGATKQDALVASMLQKAIERGDVQAGAFIRDTAGEKPTDKIAAEIETITPEDRERIERILNRTKTQDIENGD